LAGATLADIEYVEIVGFHDLRPLDPVEGQCLIALAVRFGETRLIDNTVVCA
jgi:pantoate--beta-alanine ligase